MKVIVSFKIVKIVIFCTLSAATVSLPTTMEAAEGDGTVTVCAMLSLSPSAGTSIAADITIILATSDSTPGRDGLVFIQMIFQIIFIVSAVGGSDYTEVVSMIMVFPAGSTDGDMTQCLDVNITDDTALMEGEETFTVTLTTPETYVMLGNNETEVTISDNDGKILTAYSVSL